ncbi:MAG: UDP-2,3-diacylglucosamine diphosphatase [Bacteroidales bacterium]|uniref:UDP-2,3-diacylglucosamine diphosphatase n=1 Tax=Porphyromonas sp. TaxID=1924944 RepID=UPI002974E79A|nr:UDP-2,3-diacylglucosamine diphosphatase [Porphyromonas sp.]MDD7437578.1 UDP-2,3-diacylglucosamine diphosphatase [Bacteroidales bacterium]MDY3067656.1 UDP-2,3-diacylglucosamine diphosphatase [Porphyromonas sp.]
MIYFASDMHFGAYFHQNAIEVERKFVRWLDFIEHDATHLFLVGDIFDYWFEYKYVVPRGYIRVLGKLANLADKGVEIHFFTGNHDVWIFDYLSEEIGCQVHREPTTFELLGKKFYIAHGDEFVQADKGFRFIRAIFHNRFCQKLYASIHPWFTVGLAHRWALHSRRKGMKNLSEQQYKGEQNEYLVQYAKQYLNRQTEGKQPNFFIFGHRHIVLDLMLSDKSRIAILGDWISHFSYARWDGTTFSIDTFEETEHQTNIESQVHLPFGINR